jgi:hypothetical protein
LWRRAGRATVVAVPGNRIPCVLYNQLVVVSAKASVLKIGHFVFAGSLCLRLRVHLPANVNT